MSEEQSDRIARASVSRPDGFAGTEHAKFKAFFDQNSSFAALLGPDGTLVEANRLALEFTGFTREQVVGRKLWECGWWLASDVLVERIRDGMKQAISGRTFESELPYYLANGSTRITEMSISPVWDGDNELIYLAATGIDITDRIAAEDSLQAAYGTFRYLVEHSPFGVFVVDADFRMTLVSQGAQRVFENVHPLLGADFAGVIRHIWPEPFATDVIGRFRHTLATGEPYHSPRTVESRGDTQAVEAYDWKIERILLPDGRDGVVCNFYDLSERERFAEELREQDRRKDEFLATLAHELRNPLAAISNALNWLALKLNIPSDARWGFDIVERQTRHLVRMVDDLLDLNRINTGKIELTPEWTALTEIADMAVESCGPLLTGRRHDFTVTLPPQPIECRCDKMRVAQILSNLLSNAAKYTDDGGRIEFAVTHDDEGLTATVEDNGRGLDPDDYTEIFEMFSQVGRTQGPRQGGAGLGVGLSLSKKLVELQGGSITVHSDGLGRGTRFRVFLPLPTRSLVAQQPTPARDAATAAAARRVLVVDDSSDTAESVGKLLEALGHAVQVEYDGDTAVTAAREFQPEVVLLDIGMPTMDGYQACRLMRQLPGGTDLVIVAVTGWGQEADRRRAQEAGFDHHLVKPLKLAALEKILADL